jgi:hypothetical protein
LVCRAENTFASAVQDMSINHRGREVFVAKQILHNVDGEAVVCLSPADVRRAHAEAHRSGPPVFMGSIGSRQADIDKLVRRLHSKAAHLVSAYGAGPSRPIA